MVEVIIQPVQVEVIDVGRWSGVPNWLLVPRSSLRYGLTTQYLKYFMLTIGN